MGSDVNKHFIGEKQMVHKQKQRCLTSLIINEMQISTRARERANVGENIQWKHSDAANF